jgi:hypothetical protein
LPHGLRELAGVESPSIGAKRFSFITILGSLRSPSIGRSSAGDGFARAEDADSYVPIGQFHDVSNFS